MLAPYYAGDGLAWYLGPVLPMEDTGAERGHEFRLAITFTDKQFRSTAVGVAPTLAGLEHIATRLNFVAFGGCDAD